MPGSAATKASAWSVVRISGGASRSTSGPGALMMNPASRAARTAVSADALGQYDAEQQPGAADVVDQRMPEILDGGGDVLAQCVDMVEQAVAARWCRRTASAAAAHTGLPAKVDPC